MPFKTKYGSHYHMTEGCHGATIPCGTEGLTPCSDCCGSGRADGGPDVRSGVSASAGSPSETPPSTGHGGGSHTQVTADVIGSGLPSPTSDVARVTQAMSEASMAPASAPEVSVSPEDLLRGMGDGGVSGKSDFSRLPLLGSVAELRRRGRVAGMRGDSYVVYVKDYEGGNRTNYTLSFSKPHSLRNRVGQFVRIDWEDGYWDKGGYGFVRVDGDDRMDIDSAFSFNDYETRLFMGALRGAGMSDDDFRRTVGDALEGFGFTGTPDKTTSAASPHRSKAGSSGATGRNANRRAFIDAMNAGDDFLVWLHASGTDVTDDDTLAKAFDEAVRSGRIAVPERLRATAWASVLDARERELGWD